MIPEYIWVLVVELFYLLVNYLIQNHSFRKLSILISFVLAIVYVLGAIWISDANPKLFSGTMYVTIFYAVIFFTSILSTQYFKEAWSFNRLLIVSYFIIFVLVFAIAITLIVEDEGILELFVPDDWVSNKHVKKSKTIDSQ